MPDAPTQWPSADEDFDTITDPEELRRAVTSNGEQTVTPTDTESQSDNNSDEEQDVNNDQENEDDRSAEDNVPENGEERQDQPEASVDESEHQESDNVEPANEEAADQDPEQVGDQAGHDQSFAAIEDKAVEEAYEGDPQTETEEYPAFTDQPPQASKKPRSRPSSNSVIRLAMEGLLVIAVIGLGLSVWTLKSDNDDLKSQVNQLNQNPEAVVERQTQQIISAVGKLMQLPTGETPTIANVTDASQAKQQSSFFDNAQNGDKVLMYVKTGEAILYRPSTDKIITVAPLTFTSSSTGTSTNTK